MRVRPKKYGVGVYRPGKYIGVVDRKGTQCYMAWHGMLSRVYNKNLPCYHKYGGGGVLMVEEWHEFQVFAEWWESQYKEDGWHVDKDFLSSDTPMYGPDTCILLPNDLNVFIQHMQIGNRKLYRSKKTGQYTAKITTVDHGYITCKFNTYEEALGWVQSYKKIRAKTLADRYRDVVDVRVINFLDEYSQS